MNPVGLGGPTYSPHFTSSPVTADAHPPLITLLTDAQRVLHAFILAQVADLAAADDVLQETNLVLWDKRDEYTPGTDFRAWAFRVARYQVMAYRKKRTRDRLVFKDDLITQLANDADARAEGHNDRRHALAECVGKLRDDERELLKLKYAEAKSGREIADTTGRSTDAVYQMLHRIRESLIECIRRVLAREGSK